MGKVVRLIGQHSLHATAVEVQASKRDGLGIVAIVDDLYSVRAISVREGRDIEVAVASHSGDASGACTKVLLAEVCVCPQTSRYSHLSSIVDKEQ